GRAQLRAAAVPALTERFSAASVLLQPEGRVLWQQGGTRSTPTDAATPRCDTGERTGDDHLAARHAGSAPRRLCLERRSAVVDSARRGESYGGKRPPARAREAPGRARSLGGTRPADASRGRPQVHRDASRARARPARARALPRD